MGQRVVLPFRGTFTGWVRSLPEFNKGKCQVLPFGTNNHRHQDMLGATQLESNLAENA